MCTSSYDCKRKRSYLLFSTLRDDQNFTLCSIVIVEAPIVLSYHFKNQKCIFLPKHHLYQICTRYYSTYIQL